MDLLPNEEDWCCFTDGDTMFLTPDFGNHLQNVIDDNPEYGLFTCMTNRINPEWCCVPGMWETDDIREHIKMAKELKKLGTKVEDITHYSPDITPNYLMSGFFMLFKKSAYLKSGGATTQGMLGIDNSIHKNAKDSGIRIGLIKSVYLYHWYRGGNRYNYEHLKHGDTE
jgi:hypothetical protein